MATIGDVAKMFNLPVSTIRYYDKLGLLPAMERKGGIRQFNQPEIETLRVIECLKQSGMELKDIQLFMEMVRQGPKTYQEREALFEKQLETVEEKIQELERTKAMIEFKIWYYGQAQKDGHEDNIQKMVDTRSLPKDIQALFDHAHEKQTMYCFSNVPIEQMADRLQSQAEESTNPKKRN